MHLTQDPDDRYPAELSRHIAEWRSGLSDLVTQTSESRFWRNGVHGLLFAPLFRERELVAPVPAPDSEDGEPLPPQQRATPQGDSLRGVWQAVADHSRKIHGRRVGFSLSTTAAWVTTALIGCWIAGTTLSGSMNRATIQTAADTLTKLSTTPDRKQAARALDSVDKQFDTLEVHQRDGVPWTTRFGLNRDAALSDAIWSGYAISVGRVLVAPIRVKLEERLDTMLQ